MEKNLAFIFRSTSVKLKVKTHQMIPQIFGSVKNGAKDSFLLSNDLKI